MTGIAACKPARRSEEARAGETYRQLSELVRTVVAWGVAVCLRSEWFGGKGSHRKFRHARFAGTVILSGKDGDDAQHYQEKQVRNAIRESTR